MAGKKNRIKCIISKKVQNMEVSGVRKMFEMASKMKDPIDLSVGRPDFDVPEPIKKKAISCIEKNLNSYSQTTGIKELKEKVVEKLSHKNKIKTTPENVIITSSASGGLSLVLTTIIDDGDEIIIFDPFFVGYKQMIIQNGGNPVAVKTNDDFSINFKNLRKSISSKTKAILINSPNNPCGKVYDETDLYKLAEIAKKNDLLVISDEIYEPFVYEKKHFSIGSIYENVVTINGFSKSLAITGWRVGYMCGPSEIMHNCIKVQQFNFVCAPTPFQFACVEAFDIDLSSKINEYKEKRDIVYNGLKKNFVFNKPEGAFYAYIKYPYDGEKFIADCVKNNLLVVPGNVFSEKNTNFRISYACKNDNLKKAIDILNRIAEENVAK